MKKHYFFVCFLIFSIGYGFQVMAQIDFSHNVTKLWQIPTPTPHPILFDFPKIDFSDTLTRLEFSPIPFPSFDEQTKIELPMAQAITYAWQPHFLELSMGNYLSPGLAFGYTQKEDRLSIQGKYQADLLGPRDQENSAQHHGQLRIGGHQPLSQTDHLSFSASYDYRQNHFYGYPLTDAPPTPQDIRRTTHEADLTAAYQHRLATRAATQQTAPWQVQTRAGIWLGDQQEREWYVQVDGHIALPENNKSITWGILGQAQIDQWADTSLTQTRLLASIQPFVRQQFSRGSYYVGVKGSFTNADTTQGYFFVHPAVQLNYQPLPGLLHLQLSVRGEIEPQTYRRFFVQNPFLQSEVAQELLHANQIYEAALLTQLMPVDGLTFSLEGTWGRYQNRAFFRNSADDQSRFILDYARDPFRLLTLTATAHYQKSKRWHAMASLSWQNFSFADSAQVAWHTPTLTGRASFTWKISDQWQWTQGLDMIGARPVVVPATEQTTDLKPIYDVHGTLTFRPNNRWRCFGRVRNALNQSFERFLFYPDFGWQGWLGVRYHLGKQRSFGS
ncbi:MAG: hypothetical protein ACFCUI_10200 [Bernardetiaceae bacterium]